MRAWYSLNWVNWHPGADDLSFNSMSYGSSKYKGFRTAFFMKFLFRVNHHSDTISTVNVRKSIWAGLFLKFCFQSSPDNAVHWVEFYFMVTFVGKLVISKHLCFNKARTYSHEFEVCQRTTPLPARLFDIPSVQLITCWQSTKSGTYLFIWARLYIQKATQVKF